MKFEYIFFKKIEIHIIRENATFQKKPSNSFILFWKDIKDEIRKI